MKQRRNEFKKLTIDEIRQCIKALIQIRARIDNGLPTLYARHSVKGHVKNNITELGGLIDKKKPANVSGSILFWIFKQCRFYGVRLPDCVPHIIRDNYKGVERFYCVTHDEWKRHVDVAKTKPVEKNLVVKKLIPFTDHATLRYIDRVLGIDVGELVKSIPHAKLLARADRKKAEQAIEIGGFTYVLGKDLACTTILTPNMSHHPCDKEP